VTKGNPGFLEKQKERSSVGATYKYNNMKRVTILLYMLLLTNSLAIFSQISNSGNKEHLPYKDPTLSVKERISDLIGRMTVEEKIGQLLCPMGWEMYTKTDAGVTQSEKLEKAVDEQHIGMLWATLRADPWTKKTIKTGLNPRLSAEATNAIQRYAIEKTRLGIPILIAEECPHGHMAIGTTVFPTSLGQGSTWNPSLIQEMAEVIAFEARLQGTHIGYGPILDLAREPRWSRVEETYGEDPFLISQMGSAVIRGFQGDALNSGVNIVSTLKHFVAYGSPEGGHNSASVHVGNRELYQNMLYPFHAAVKAGALSIMSSYNSIDGVPCSSNRDLLTDLVRGKWGFEGFFVSDLGSIRGLMSSHRVASSPTQAASLALNAGLDVDLGGAAYITLMDAIKQDLVTLATIDEAVERVLKIKFEMRLFENPYVDVEKAGKEVKTRKHQELAKQVARESIVLLKNENAFLPLKKTIKSIAVIGPNADNMYNQLGDYTAPQEEGRIVTVLEGIKAKITKDTQLTYVKGCAIRDTSETNIEEAIESARNADVAIIVLGGSSARDFRTEYENTGAALVSDAKKNLISDMESGEGYDRATLEVMGKQLELLQGVINTGTPVVVVLIEGRPLNLAGMEDDVAGLLTAWYPGEQGGHAIADILFGDYNPAGRLPVSVPGSVGQLPVYYNNLSPRRSNYVDMTGKPLFVFGHGLSYTTFDYSNIEVVPDGKNEKDFSLKVILDVRNTGDTDGDEVIQLYVKDMVASVVTPEKQLRGFQRVSLKTGEQKQITFKLNAEDLALWDQNMERVVEPGEFLISIGASSEDIRLNSKFEIQDKISIK